MRKRTLFDAVAHDFSFSLFKSANAVLGRCSRIKSQRLSIWSLRTLSTGSYAEGASELPICVGGKRDFKELKHSLL